MKKCIVIVLLACSSQAYAMGAFPGQLPDIFTLLDPVYQEKQTAANYAQQHGATTIANSIRNNPTWWTEWKTDGGTLQSFEAYIDRAERFGVLK